MNLQQIRWPVMVSAMVLTLGVLFGAGYMMKNVMVDEPLKAVYAKTPAVDQVTIDRGSDVPEVQVKLKETEDLASTYSKLDEETRKVMKGTPYRLKVTDQRNPQLEQAYRRVNLFVQEAMTTGEFAAMADKVEQEAIKVGMTARLAVDSKHIYVQLHGAGGYLYAVEDRQMPKSAGVGGGFGL